ncbi:MAG: DsrE family protein [Bacteroidota bacterium]|jgi:intracellular sulfur oxidation DsrE/DsrF family protein
MRNRFVILSFLTLILVNVSFGQTVEKQHKIVFHLASSDTLVHKSLVKQVANVLDYWKNAKIEVVVHNNGIGFMKQDEARFVKEIDALRARGAVFAVCENTLKQRKIDKSQILVGATFVPVGLAEIVLKEEDGWSYIKAGF